MFKRNTKNSLWSWTTGQSQAQNYRHHWRWSRGKCFSIYFECRVKISTSTSHQSFSHLKVFTPITSCWLIKTLTGLGTAYVVQAYETWSFTLDVSEVQGGLIHTLYTKYCMLRSQSQLRMLRIRDLNISCFHISKVYIIWCRMLNCVSNCVIKLKQSWNTRVFTHNYFVVFFTTSSIKSC